MLSWVALLPLAVTAQPGQKHNVLYPASCSLLSNHYCVLLVCGHCFLLQLVAPTSLHSLNTGEWNRRGFIFHGLHCLWAWRIFSGKKWRRRHQGRNVNVREEGLTSQQTTTSCPLPTSNIVYLYVQAPRTWNHEVHRPEEWGRGQNFLQFQGTHRPLAIWWPSSLSRAREAKVPGNFLQSPCPWSFPEFHSHSGTYYFS